MNSLLFLARYVRHRTSRALRLGRSGELQSFLDQHKSDRLRAVSVEDGRIAVAAERCTNCGACVTGCTAVREGIAPPTFEPRTLVMAFDVASNPLSEALKTWAPCGSCGECVAVCPMGVPVHRIAERFGAVALEK